MKYFLPITLMIIGLSMSIIYPFALSQMYGEIVKERSILRNNTLVAGNQTFTRGEKHLVSGQAYGVYLSPEMNPIRISFPAKFIKDRYALMDKYSRFTANLKLDGTHVWSMPLSVKQARDSKNKKIQKDNNKHRHKKSNLGSRVFEVKDAGQYTLEFLPGKRQELEVTKIDLVVKKNVVLPEKWIIGLGLVQLVAGFGWFARVRKLSDSA